LALHQMLNLKFENYVTGCKGLGSV